jgi:hypothetical protein
MSKERDKVNSPLIGIELQDLNSPLVEAFHLVHRNLLCGSDDGLGKGLMKNLGVFWDP